MQTTKRWHRETSKPCPIEGCPYHYLTLDGLEAHLYLKHRKNELIGALLKVEKQKGVFETSQLP